MQDSSARTRGGRLRVAGLVDEDLALDPVPDPLPRTEVHPRLAGAGVVWVNPLLERAARQAAPFEVLGCRVGAVKADVAPVTNFLVEADAEQVGSRVDDVGRATGVEDLLRDGGRPGAVRRGDVDRRDRSSGCDGALRD